MKIIYISTFLLAFLQVSFVSAAGFSRKIEGSPPSENTSPVRYSRRSQISTGTGLACTGDKNGYYLSLKNVHAILGGSTDMLNLSGVTNLAEGPSVQLTVGSHVGACMDLKFDFFQKSNNSEYFVAARNIFDLDGYLKNSAKTKLTQTNLDAMSPSKKYDTCLKDKGLLNSKDELVADNNVQGTTQTLAIKTNDTSKIKAYFLSSTDEIGEGWGTVAKTEGRGPEDCFTLENLGADNKELVVYESRDETEKSSVLNICRSGKPEEMLKKIADLRSNNSIGNAEELIKFLENAHEKSLASYAEELLDKMEDKYEQILNAEDRDEASGDARELMALVDEADENIISFINTHMQRLIAIKKTESGDKRDETEEEIERLADIAGQFSEYNSENVLIKLNEFGLSRRANKLAEFHLKSEQLSKITGSSSARKVRDSKKVVKKRLRNFREKSKIASMKYNAGQGRGVYSHRFNRRVDSLNFMADMQERAHERRMQTYAKDCQPSSWSGRPNRGKCSKAMKRMEALDKRYQRVTVPSLERQLRVAQGHFAQFRQLEAGAERRRRAEQGDDPNSLFGSEYSLFSDEFGVDPLYGNTYDLDYRSAPDSGRYPAQRDGGLFSIPQFSGQANVPNNGGQNNGFFPQVNQQYQQPFQRPMR
jgi:hypothetical protein